MKTHGLDASSNTSRQQRGSLVKESAVAEMPCAFRTVTCNTKNTKLTTHM